MKPLSPEHMAAPGLIVYWFGSDLFYASFNRFAGQAHKLVTDSQSPVTWLVVDAAAITSIDYTAGGGLKELTKELGKKGGYFGVCPYQPELQSGSGPPRANRSHRSKPNVRDIARMPHCLSIPRRKPVGTTMSP
jgi:MFS superfamily sulfate permease-like transporter